VGAVDGRTTRADRPEYALGVHCDRSPVVFSFALPENGGLAGRYSVGIGQCERGVSLAAARNGSAGAIQPVWRSRKRSGLPGVVGPGTRPAAGACAEHGVIAARSALGP
jgi:hypothetical protein